MRGRAEGVGGQKQRPALLAAGASRHVLARRKTSPAPVRTGFTLPAIIFSAAAVAGGPRPARQRRQLTRRFKVVQSRAH